jgi:secondary thiamine-phosphate synthase enzyme
MLTVETSERQEMIDITSRVEDALTIQDGICHVFTKHTTAAVIINENWDENLPDDIFAALTEAIPQHNDYHHDNVDGNAQSHILSTMLGPSEAIPVRNGSLDLGRWQAVMLVELDGPRSRNVQVTQVES